MQGGEVRNRRVPDTVPYDRHITNGSTLAAMAPMMIATPISPTDMRVARVSPNSFTSATMAARQGM